MITREPNSKAIILDDPEACLLVKRRAVDEDRSARKALARTIIESLGPKYGKSQQAKNTKQAARMQAKNPTEFPV
jgi:hypothetical protein